MRAVTTMSNVARVRDGNKLHINDVFRGPADKTQLTTSERLLCYRRIIILTEGESTSGRAKTAIGLLTYRTADIAGVLDSTFGGQTCQELFGVGGNIPVIASLDQIVGADALFVGIAPAGGKLPPEWREVISEALRNEMDVVSGLHDFIVDDSELRAIADLHRRSVIDVRRNCHRSVAVHVTYQQRNLRIHTVGHDCSVGKMVAAVELDRGLRQRGHDSQFLATGQTGIMIDGKGVPVDAVVADFVSGAVEEMVLGNEHHDTLVIEGQGSLAHPSFSGVTLSLLHGCAPHGLIMCYDASRESVKGLGHVSLQPLSRLIKLYEALGSLRHPCKVIGVAINGRGLSEASAASERDRVRDELGLPACDVYRDSPTALVEAVLEFRNITIQ